MSCWKQMKTLRVANGEAQRHHQFQGRLSSNQINGANQTAVVGAAGAVASRGSRSSRSEHNSSSSTANNNTFANEQISERSPSQLHQQQRSSSLASLLENGTTQLMTNKTTRTSIVVVATHAAADNASTTQVIAQDLIAIQHDFTEPGNVQSTQVVNAVMAAEQLQEHYHHAPNRK